MSWKDTLRTVLFLLVLPGLLLSGVTYLAIKTHPPHLNAYTRVVCVFESAVVLDIQSTEAISVERRPNGDDEATFISYESDKDGTHGLVIVDDPTTCTKTAGSLMPPAAPGWTKG